jgi:hypothetical protein
MKRRRAFGSGAVLVPAIEWNWRRFRGRTVVNPAVTWLVLRRRQRGEVE